MYIVMVSSECAPISKVGGLADVVDGLSRELQLRGHSVEIILPKYDCMSYGEISNLKEETTGLWVPYYDQWINCSVSSGTVRDLRCLFISPHHENRFFERGVFYGQKDDSQRFAFFSRAVLEFLHKTNRNPDIIHCHDWQTGLIPVLLKEVYSGVGMNRPKVCYTIHNIKHQGTCGSTVLEMVGLNPARCARMIDDGNPKFFNLMKGGIVYSDVSNTVSPQYAWEVKNTDQGYGLERILSGMADKFVGILNGLDYDSWNPEKDTVIPHKYGISTIENKYRNKEALQERLWLAKKPVPIIAAVGRLDMQKGVHLIKHALFYALENNCQFILLGSSPDKEISEYFEHLKMYMNNNQNCHLEIGFDEELSHLIYSGSDMIIVPSLYEPCGLTQLIGMKYGTIPVVRKTGGLSDTVFDIDIPGTPLDKHNGFVFTDFSTMGIEDALSRAIGMYNSNPTAFRQVIINAMKADYSWNLPGADYINAYKKVIAS